LTIPYLNLKDLQARFSDQDMQSLKVVQESGQFIGGDVVSEFESDFATYCGVSHAVGTGNGLDALTLILLAEKQLGHLPKNAKILLPAHTYIATFLSVIHAGMQPVPVDVTDLTISVSDLEPHCNNVDAIVVVDIYGKLVDDAVYAFAKAKQLSIYCDTAQSHGARNASGQRSGSLARASAFSFYPTKNLGALGDSGAVTTDDTELSLMVRKLANYGRESRFVNDVVGMNSRLDPLQASFLSTRLKQLDADNLARLDIAKRYLIEIDNEQVQVPKRSFFDHNAIHVFPVFIDDRDAFIGYLKELGIATNCHYPIAPHHQEALAFLKERSFPNTEEFHRNQVSIPCHPLLSSDEVTYIIQSINSYE